MGVGIYKVPSKWIVLHDGTNPTRNMTVEDIEHEILNMQKKYKDSETNWKKQKEYLHSIKNLDIIQLLRTDFYKINELTRDKRMEIQTVGEYR